MTTIDSPPNELMEEIEQLRLRLEEAEDMLRAIGSGEVDAFVVSGPDGEQVFTLKGAEHPYRVLVETMNEGAATLAADGTIFYCNNRLAAMLQVPLERLIGTQLGSYVTPADRPLFDARLGKCTDKYDLDEITMITGAGNAVPVMISCCAADISGNREIGMVVTDLTQQKRNEETKAAKRLAHAIIEQAGEAIFVCDEGGRIIRSSWLAQQLCGENPLLKTFDDLLKLRFVETECLFSVLAPLHGESFESVEVEFKQGDDQVFYLLLNATPLKSEQNGIIGCIVTLTDITEHKRVEEEARQLNEIVAQKKDRLSALVNSITDEIWFVDTMGQFTLVNPAANREFMLHTDGTSDVRELAASLEVLLPNGSPRPIEEAPPLRALRGEVVRNLEELIRTPATGKLQYRQVSAAPVRDSKGSIIGSVSVVRDITELKQAEKQIKESLAEKEVMLKEIHHRVKNNLQLISSLVNLQANGSKDESVREVLKDVTYRVHSMALVHEKLYQSADLARVDFSEYARTLLSYLWCAHGAAATNVRLTLDLEPVLLPVDTAVPCGLILNELAGNALKHAFQGLTKGEVTVSLQCAEDDSIRLRVQDNGVGLPDGFVWHQTSSLGLRLVQMLSKQLGAGMEVSGEDGTRFEIVFRVDRRRLKAEEYKVDTKKTEGKAGLPLSH